MTDAREPGPQDSGKSADRESDILAAYHESLISGSDAAKPEKVEGLDATLECLRMIERNRKLIASSLQSVKKTSSLGTDETQPNHRQKNEVPETGRFGRFEVIRKLGAGGNGVVLLARDSKLNRKVAIKVPTPSALLNDEYLIRFEREAKVAARLRHKNIVSVLEAGSIGPIPYIATDYCSGPTLLDWLEERVTPISPKAIAKLIRALADALHHAHSRGVLHRDVKPANILLELGGEQKETKITEDELHDLARIADFGLAKDFDDTATLTYSKAIVGTPAYMSPEQAEGRPKDIGERSDLFSLGVVFYELLTGIAPFTRKTAYETMRAVRVETPMSVRRLRADVSADFEAVCQKCLEKKQNDRYSAANLVADLDRFLAR